MGFFENIVEFPADPILGLSVQFTNDPRKNKVNLGAGIYKTADLKPLILNSVKKAEGYLLERETSKDYLPIDGEKLFIQKTNELVFGNTAHVENVYGAQTIGATGALKLASLFFKEQNINRIYIPEVSWDNHYRIFSHSNLEVKTYPYYEPKKRAFDGERFVQFLHKAPPKSLVMLHACCHNPTGLDPSFSEWQEIFTAMQKKNHIAFFDNAYQGFGEGLDTDAYGIRLFLEKECPFVVAVSHGKNFGLYAERSGALFIRCQDSEEVKKVASHIKVLIRSSYSNPPCHGARIVQTILSDASLKTHWEHELKAIRERILEMRKNLVTLLQTKTKSSFDFILRQKGMFAYFGFDASLVDRLIEVYGVYMTKDGRINLAGLNTENVEYVADALATVIQAP